MTRRMKLCGWLCHSLLVVGVLEGCGPPLTQPSSQNISGRWAATKPIGPLSVVNLVLTQLPDGTVSGQWSGTVFPPNPACPPELGTTPTGPVNGTNTVLEVRLSILGLGDFAGQAIDDNTLKGSLLSCSNVYAVVFSFVGPLPPT